MKNDFLKGKRILIAEDDFVNQKLINHSMQSTGAAFDIVGNGREAIELLMQGKYDMVLMDINMPEMDGFEATEYIRKNLKLKIPIIAMTGWSSKEDSNKIERIGMNGTLAKPFGLEMLYQVLNDILIAQEAVKFQQSEISTEAPKDDTLVVDLTMLNELSETDNEYKKTIINMFLDTMPETLQQLDAAHAAKDWDTLAKSAHYAKSSLSVINVEALRLLMGRIEMNAKKLENLDQLAAMIEDAKAKYARTVEYLQEVLKSYQ